MLLKLKHAAMSNISLFDCLITVREYYEDVETLHHNFTVVTDTVWEIPNVLVVVPLTPILLPYNLRLTVVCKLKSRLRYGSVTWRLQTPVQLNFLKLTCNGVSFPMHFLIHYAYIVCYFIILWLH